MVSGLGQNRREKKKNKWLKLNLHQQKTTKRTKNAHKHIAQLDMTRDSMQRRVNTESNKTEKSSDRNVRDNILLYFSCLYDIIIWFLLIRFHVVKKRKCPMSALLNPICFFWRKEIKRKKIIDFSIRRKIIQFLLYVDFRQVCRNGIDSVISLQQKKTNVDTQKNFVFWISMR